MIDNIEDFNDKIKESEDKVVVVWKADWCGPCKAMAPLVEEVAKQNPDVKLHTVDIEGEGIDDVLREYGIRSVPTFSRIESGTLKKTACGTISKTEISEFFQENV